MDRLASAEWADPEAFAETHAYAPGTFWLGRSPLTGRPLGYDDDRHICLVSGSRAGKGTTTIIPNLCLWPGSVVVVDPKGENATVTAARRGPGSERCKGLGQAVHVLDPFGAASVDDSLRSRFNPLDALDPADPHTIDDAGRLASAIVVIPPDSREPHWDERARSMIKALILHILTAPEFEGRRTLVTLRELITRGDHEGVAILRDELGEDDPASARALLWEGVANNGAFGGVVAGLGEQMASMLDSSPRQFESVIQVADRNTEFLDSPGMAECLSASDFALSELKTAPEGVSLYLSLPQRFMGEHFRWLRMMITLVVNEMEAVPGKPATGHRVLMCLDEFAGLKHMEVIENAVAQIAGFGVKLFFVLQSLEQLKATYKDNWETFLSNAGLKLFFGLDDKFSREYVSEFIGDAELQRSLASSSTTTSQQTTRSAGTTSSTSWSDSESHGTNQGTSFSDNWKAMPLFLRNTAGLFAAISGKRQASRNRNLSSSDTTAKSKGGGESAQESTATGTSEGQTSGQSESLYKRPLVTPDEVGRYFGRIDDPGDLFYPGMGLVVVTGASPSPVQRVNYFEDAEFHRCFDAHPDHAFSEAAEVLFPFPSNEAISYLTPSVHYVEGQLLAQPGSRVSAGEPLIEFDVSKSRWMSESVGGYPALGISSVILRSPVSGTVLSLEEQGGAAPFSYDEDTGTFTAYKTSSPGAPYRGTLALKLLASGDGDSEVVSQNEDAVLDYCARVRDRQRGFASTKRFKLACAAVILALAMGFLAMAAFVNASWWLGLFAAVCSLGGAALLRSEFRISGTPECPDFLKEVGIP